MSDKCAKIVPDLQFLFSAPVRLSCARFEQSGFLTVLPDNKIVEDCHQAVRVEAKSHPNQKMTVPRVQSCVMNSNIFSSRKLFHVGKLTKDEFVQKWGKKQTADEQYGRKIFSSRYHRLPQSFSNIMKKKSWTSVNEEQYGKSYAAWEWIRFYAEHTLAETNVKVDDTWILIEHLLLAGIVSSILKQTYLKIICFSLISLGCTCRMVWTLSCVFLVNFCHSYPQRRLFSALAIDFGQLWCGRWRHMVIMTGFKPTSSAPIHPLGGHLSFHSTQMTG